MKKNLHELEKILAVPDKTARRARLSELARSLGMLPVNTPSGKDFAEEKFVLAIYDGFARQQKQKEKTLRMLVMMIGVGVLITVVAMVIPQSVIQYFQSLQSERQEYKRTRQGFDEKGNMVRDEAGRPVLFHEMNGFYDEYYDDGSLHFTYLYVEGRVVEEKEYGRGGDLIAHIVYDKHGNPALMRK